MKIINSSINADIQQGTGLRLNFGAGERRLNGFYSLDVVEMPGIDIVADLSSPLTELPDGCVDELVSHHVFEHVPNLICLMEEIYRITRKDSKIRITVPHFSNTYGFSDPTHVRYFGLYSMYYFTPVDLQPKRKVPNFYSKARFDVRRISFRFYRYSLADRVLISTILRFVNRSFRMQEWYERRLSFLLPARDITFELVPIK